ncbi:hypothetical protein [Streptomyces sp. WL006]|uniref:hypothetical protein n=1 Tax=Streptomyces sp. WL006 TaxID=3423915 RepID=UPI003F6BFFDA
MYAVTLAHPQLDDRRFFCPTPGALRDVVWGAARAHGQPITAEGGRDSEMIAEVGYLRSRADNGGIGTLTVFDFTVTVEPVGTGTEFDCEGGHEGEDAALLGGPATCDGRCRPRPRFGHQALTDLVCALDDAELDESGGCGACGLEAGQMCVGCGRCNCDGHDGCARPAEGGDLDDCRYVENCGEDPATGCGLSGTPHIHPEDPNHPGAYGECPVHPERPGDR